MLISHNPAEKHFLVMQAICLKIKIIIIKSSHIEFLNGINAFVRKCIREKMTLCFRVHVNN